MTRARVLVIDDEEAVRSSLRMILEYEGYRFLQAGSGKEGIRTAETERPDAILLDIKMPRMDGLEVLPILRQQLPDTPVIIISGHGTIQTAVEAIRLGAADFLEKPFKEETVLSRLRMVLAGATERKDIDPTRLQFEDRYRILGEAPALEPVREAIARAAPTRVSVLVTGESGVGKELVARAVHRNSPRRDAPFIRVNCAAIPEELIESELFGHEKGSFTGATRDQAGKFVQADGGTIFLDEVGDMSLKTQAKVLRVLQDGEVEPVGAPKPFTVDVRVIAATNHDLAAAIAKGQFREDLYYRLNVVPIEVPPLRERLEDVPLLVREFASVFAKENGIRARKFTEAAIARLRRHAWTGNVRELKNTVERALILSDAESVDLPDVERAIGASMPAGRRGGAVGPQAGAAAAGGEAGGEAGEETRGHEGGDGGRSRSDAAVDAAAAGAQAGRGSPGGEGGGFPDDDASGESGAEGPSEAEPMGLQAFKDASERAFIVRKLRENDWNITQTARAIDTTRSNLYKKLEQYGITREKDGGA